MGVGFVKSVRGRDFIRMQDSWYVLLTLTGYVEVLVIPAGARRIKVVEEKPAHSFLGNWHCRLRNLVRA